MHPAETPVTFILLLLNVLVSGYVLFQDPGLIDRMAFKPRAVLQRKEWYRMITGGFLHAGLGHLLFNMITLFFFGPFLEMVVGSVTFAAIYFGSELGAHALTLVRHKDNPHYAAVGASGAISGVLFGFCLFRPLDLLYVFFAIPMPAILFAVLYVVGSAYAMRQGEQHVSGGIAHEAHLGGALAGLALTLVLEPRSLGIFLGQLGLF